MKPTSPFFFRRLLRLAATVALLAGAPAHAQESQSNTALPQTIPGLETFSIAPGEQRPTPPRIAPTPTPAPQVVQPVQPLTIQPLPTPTPTPTRRATRQAPSPVTPTPSPAATPVPASAEPAPQPIPSATPAMRQSPPVVAASPTPAVPSPAAQQPLRPSLVWAFVLIALLILPGAVVAAWFYRRALNERREMPGEGEASPPLPQALAAAPASPPAPPVQRHTPASTARPRLEVAFRPRRAGTNLTSAAVDYELVVRNTGTLPAYDVRLGVDLVTAGNDHDAQLRALFDQGIERPATPPFDLAAGAERTVRAMVMLPKDAITVVSVRGRPMFVPMVAVNALYRWDGGTGQTASSHVVGIERTAGERMRPFWLDVTPRMHDVVSERPHVVTVQR